MGLEILTEIVQIKTVAAKFISRLSTLEQKENRLSIFQDSCNFFLYFRTQFAFKRQRFEYVKGIKDNVITKR